MTLPRLIQDLQARTNNKVVTAQRRDRRCFEVDLSLDQEVKIGTSLMWSNMLDLARKDYAIILYSQGTPDNEPVRMQVIGEMNCFRVTGSPTNEIRVGPTSFREIYERITPYRPVVVTK